jgi:hypothetical protein
VSSSQGLHILGPMRALVSMSACNSRTHVIILYSGHECVVLCVNALVLTPRMDLG